MQYVGSKTRGPGPRIAALLNAVIADRELRVYAEPFCGALSVLCKVKAPRRLASDACEALITFHQAVQAGWVPPDELTKEQWAHYKATQDPQDPMTALAGFGCSWGGNYFSSYSATYKFTKRRVTTAFAASQSARNKMAKCADVEFACRDYRRTPPADITYCDTPYAGTVGYPAVGPFDHEAFWAWARERSKGSLLVASEMTAPEDFTPVLDFNVQNRIATASRTRRQEYLFAHESQADTWREYTND